MRIALISDVHANLEALRSVLDDVGAMGVDELVCLGDIVGYGPDPRACLDLVFESADAIVLGNHDEAVAETVPGMTFNAPAMVSLEFTRDAVTQSQRRRLRGVPRTMRLDDLTLAHASFGAPSYEYVRCGERAARSFGALQTRLGAIGHTHQPGVFTCPASRPGTRPDPRNVSVDTLRAGGRRFLPAEHRCLLNPGSVGQPRDGDRCASWGVLDLSAQTFEVRRVPYDAERTAAKILRLGLPPGHARRLLVGT